MMKLGIALWALFAALVTAACGGAPCVPTGDKLYSFAGLGGNGGDYVVHLPPAYDGHTPLPVVFNYHGNGGDACGQAEVSGMSPLADREGFVVVYPIGRDNVWNGEDCCYGLYRNDMSYSHQLVLDVQARFAVDPKRFYLTGFSQGAVMVNTIACKRSELFAAAAPVAGMSLLFVGECQPVRAMPILHFHGSADTNVPYSPPTDGTPYFSTAQLTVQGWVERDHCVATPTEVVRDGPTHCDRWDGCDDGANITFCTIDGGGHCWPGRKCWPEGTPSNTTYDATGAIWAFLRNYSLP